ncbi:hypothetical protein ACFOHU_00940 [Ottowia pentelensis]|uniref:Uncharacterized protein n=1 Tax=Ottowia pentelensis TaxID=511108 RepID=A0ABV6PMR7_9BURK
MHKAWGWVRAGRATKQKAARGEKEDAVSTNLRKKHAFSSKPLIIAASSRFVTG